MLFSPINDFLFNGKSVRNHVDLFVLYFLLLLGLLLLLLPWLLQHFCFLMFFFFDINFNFLTLYLYIVIPEPIVYCK